MEFMSASELAEAMSKMVQSVMAAVGVVTKEDFVQLEKRVTAIEKQLSEKPARKKPGRPPGKKTARKKPGRPPKAKTSK
ncbi:MAG: hypothetical protein L6427_07585 [Actinomycetia bacterium]|nr:hypothetical protein [Actinomycetes bacterium]